MYSAQKSLINHAANERFRDSSLPAVAQKDSLSGFVLSRIHVIKKRTRFECSLKLSNRVFGPYFTITISLPLRPNTSGEYISSAFAGGATKVLGVVARAI